MIVKLKFELFPHPAYSAHLAPYDNNIIGPRKDALLGHRFADDEEVKDAVLTGLRA
jgi:hypothetical protein